MVDEDEHNRAMHRHCILRLRTKSGHQRHTDGIAPGTDQHQSPSAKPFDQKETKDPTDGAHQLVDGSQDSGPHRV